MGRRLEIEPAWLVGLLSQWAIHSLRDETGGLGYASGSGWMRGLKSSPASSVDPTGYAARDFRGVDAAMDAMMRSHRDLWAAVTMYYKPWMVEAMRAEGYPFCTTTYYTRLQTGHREIAWLMNARRDERENNIRPLVFDEAD
jgi:hypothetical protein